MVFEALRRPSGPSLDTIIGQVAEMLGSARHVFDAAMSALVAGADPSALGDDIHATDRRINALEQEVRRELVVHASVHGTGDITGVMILLMVSRKIERIGDNAKNIHDLAQYGVDLSGAHDVDELRTARDEVSQMMGDAAEIFRVEDTERAPGFLDRTRELQTIYDERVEALIRSDEPLPDDVSRALLYRYLKRIVANLEGVVAGVVQSIDTIDYSPDFSEASET